MSALRRTWACLLYTSGPSVNPLEVEKLLEAMDEKQEQELQELRDENKMMQTLATTGIITDMFMHEDVYKRQGCGRRPPGRLL